jgi:hypothetical protein
MNWPDFLTCGPRGEIRVTGNRIDLYQLVQIGESANLARSPREASIAPARGASLELPEFLCRHEKEGIRLRGHRIDLSELGLLGLTKERLRP